MPSPSMLRRLLPILDPTRSAEALARAIDDIARIAAALNAGEEWRARAIATQFGLPALTHDTMTLRARDASPGAKVINPATAWDPGKHPRWPSGQSDGGRFRPGGGDGDGTEPPLFPAAARAGQRQAKPSAKPQRKPRAQKGPPSTAWKNYPNVAMREKLSELESSAGKANNGHGEKSKTSTALGRYQILEPSLIDAKWKNADGSWTEKAKEAGVTSDNEFRANPDAQEKALTDVLQRYTEQLKANGALSKIGTTIRDSDGQPLLVTEAGLLAAANKGGARRVAEYLDPNKKSALSAEKVANIEHRLREAADTPYDAAATARQANASDRGPNARRK